jgi:hypothetical protein
VNSLTVAGNSVFVPTEIFYQFKIFSRFFIFIAAATINSSNEVMIEMERSTNLF